MQCTFAWGLCRGAIIPWDSLNFEIATVSIKYNEIPEQLPQTSKLLPELFNLSSVGGCFKPYTHLNALIPNKKHLQFIIFHFLSSSLTMFAHAPQSDYDYSRWCEASKNKFIYHDKFSVIIYAFAFLHLLWYILLQPHSHDMRCDKCYNNLRERRIKIYNMDIFWICNEIPSGYGNGGTEKNCSESMQGRIFINHCIHINHRETSGVQNAIEWEANRRILLSSCGCRLSFM